VKIAVIGVGGVGGGFGAPLAEAGYDVSFIARGPHLAAMQQNGLRIVGQREVHVDPVIAAENVDFADPVDFVLLTVKLWAVREAAEMISPLLHDDTAVVTLQNGVEAARIVADVVGAVHVMGGVAEISAAIEEPGVIRLNSPYTRIRFGELDGRMSGRGEALEAACVAAGIETKFSTDIEKDLWEKFMLLVPISGLTSVTRSTFGTVCQDSDSRALIEDCLREVIAVARAKGVAVDPDSFEKTMSLVDATPPQGRASMAVDLELGNRLELPWLSGAVVRMGSEAGVPTPVNSFLYTALKFHQDGRS
jgi:2-dehydropantoate 2-reductase